MCSYMENRDRRESDINSPETECYLVAVYPNGKDCELPTGPYTAIGWRRFSIEDERQARARDGWADPHMAPQSELCHRVGKAHHHRPTILFSWTRRPWWVGENSFGGFLEPTEGESGRLVTQRKRAPCHVPPPTQSKVATLVPGFPAECH